MLDILLLVHRGLYRTSTGFKFNADVNGALNILRKSKVVSLSGLYSKGGLATPTRIRMPVLAGGNVKSNFLRSLHLGIRRLRPIYSPGKDY